MNTTEYRQYDALGLAELVRSKEVTPLELLHAALTLTEETQSTINAVAHVNAYVGENNVNRPGAGIFYGVPFLIKELLAYPGLVTAMGSRLFAKYVPEVGSDYTRQIDGSGLVTFGNTTSSEFGLLGSTETLLHGATHNPRSHEYAAAGSSGGSAAAVAAGIVPMAHASDGGGSIRIPASVCGLFGFMPTPGRCVPALDAGGPYGNLVVDHCISKTVRDSAAFLSVTEDKGTPTRQSKFPPLGFIKHSKQKKLRIGFYTTTLLGNAAVAEVVDAVRHTQSLCESLGHDVIETSGPDVDGKAISLAFFTLAGLAMDKVCRLMEPLLQSTVNEDVIESFTYQLICWFRSLDADAVSKSVDILQRSGDRMLQFAGQYDVLLCPTLVSAPQKIGFLSPMLDRDVLIERTERYVGYTPIHNISGMCAMSLPLFTSSSGLPIGSHFAAMPGAEATLMNLAYHLEIAAPWTASQNI